MEGKFPGMVILCVCTLNLSLVSFLGQTNALQGGISSRLQFFATSKFVWAKFELCELYGVSETGHLQIQFS